MLKTVGCLAQLSRDVILIFHKGGIFFSNMQKMRTFEQENYCLLAFGGVYTLLTNASSESVWRSPSFALKRS